MRTDEDQVKRKQSPQAAAIDVKRYNAQNEDLYSPEQRAKAVEIRDMLDSAYFGAKVYSPNYRAKFIAIKVEKPGGHRFCAEVRKADKELEARGVIIKKTPANSFIYQLPENV